MDLSIFALLDTWITLITLIFLEIVLGVDNIVFISITTNRLPQDKQHIGRILGLAGAFISRALFLSVAAWLTHMVDPIFTVDVDFYEHGFSVRDIILFCGGAYLIYKGIIELRDVLALTEEKDEAAAEAAEVGSGGESDELVVKSRTIGLPQAIATIMVMDIVFSIDSVITAVGLSNHLIVMIIAVMLAIILMMLFIDAISNFINKHIEMKILALTFIVAIGVLLFVDAMGITSGIEVLGMHMEKLMVYFAMVFAVVLECIQMRRNSNYRRWMESRGQQQASSHASAQTDAAEDDLLDEENARRGKHAR